MKTVLGIHTNTDQHWVGDGFPVRTLFSYGNPDFSVNPFLLLDFGGPTIFQKTTQQRGVGQHPHRGFETVTIVYEGEVAHRDSTGAGGVIGPGDVQWMTAGRGIVHEEFHSPAFTSTGGAFHMVQLWVNLPAKDKMAAPGYQSITNAQIPTISLSNSAGRARIIAGELNGARGPAHTFTPINVWDLRLNGEKPVSLDLPEGHTVAVIVIAGRITVNGSASFGEAEMVLLSKTGQGGVIEAETPSTVLVLTGEPIDEPVAGYGPFVMNTQEEIRTAIDDFNAGRFVKQTTPTT